MIRIAITPAARGDGDQPSKPRPSTAAPISGGFPRRCWFSRTHEVWSRLDGATYETRPFTRKRQNEAMLEAR